MTQIGHFDFSRDQIAVSKYGWKFRLCPKFMKARARMGVTVTLFWTYPGADCMNIPARCWIWKIHLSPEKLEFRVLRLADRTGHRIIVHFFCSLVIFFFVFLNKNVHDYHMKVRGNKDYESHRISNRSSWIYLLETCISTGFMINNDNPVWEMILISDDISSQISNKTSNIRYLVKNQTRYPV